MARSRRRDGGDAPRGDAPPAVHIARATLRVSGVDARDAGALGRAVTRRVEAALARAPRPAGERALGALTLRVALPPGGEPGVREAALAERIAAAIVRAVGP